jgi:glyoxylase-like metal-dependent hydrolase (beta-lactamase superfamily II)
MSHTATTADGAEQNEINGTFREIGKGCYAYCVEGGSNTGIVVGERGVLVVDAQPTPQLSGKVREEIERVTDKPIRHLVLTHFHIDSGLGAGTFDPGEIVSSDLTNRMIVSRGEEDRSTALTRQSELFAGAGRLPASPQPTMSFASSMTIELGRRQVRLMHLGRGHTVGDVVVWVPDAGVLFAGDLVAHKTACYCGDAHLADWPKALDRIGAFRPQVLLPGRGRPLVGQEQVSDVLLTTRTFIDLLRDTAAASVDAGKGLKTTFEIVKDALDERFDQFADYENTLPFNVARAYDEAHGLDIPQVWTAERDRDLADALQGMRTQDKVETASSRDDSEEHDGDDQSEDMPAINLAEVLAAELVRDAEIAAVDAPVEDAAEAADEPADATSDGEAPEAPAEGEDLLDLSLADIVEPEETVPPKSASADAQAKRELEMISV